MVFDLGTCSKNECFYNITPFLVVILVAILNFVMMLPLNQLNIITTGFLDPKNLHLDNKIMVLVALEPDLLWVFYKTSALLVAILNFVLILPLNQLNIKIDFVHKKTLSFDIKIMVIATLEPHLWPFL